MLRKEVRRREKVWEGSRSLSIRLKSSNFESLSGARGSRIRSRPWGFVTRIISSSTGSALVMWWKACWQLTKWKLASGKGMCSASAQANAALAICFSVWNSRAWRSILGVKSIPQAKLTRGAIARINAPGPQATSRTSSWGWGLANSTFSARTSGESRTANLAKASAVLVNCFWTVSLCFLDMEALSVQLSALSDLRWRSSIRTHHLTRVTGRRTVSRYREERRTQSGIPLPPRRDRNDAVAWSDFRCQGVRTEGWGGVKKSKQLIPRSGTKAKRRAELNRQSQITNREPKITKITLVIFSSRE